MGGHVDFLRFLAWIGADLNVVEGRGGRSAMHLAVGSKNMAVIQSLLELSSNGSVVNANQLDWYGRTPFNMAACNGALDIAHLLASHVSGCDVTVLSEMQTGDITEASSHTNMLLNSSA
jgi:ankyrin repeat protein